MSSVHSMLFEMWNVLLIQVKWAFHYLFVFLIGLLYVINSLLDSLILFEIQWIVASIHIQAENKINTQKYIYACECECECELNIYLLCRNTQYMWNSRTQFHRCMHNIHVEYAYVYATALKHTGRAKAFRL